MCFVKKAAPRPSLVTTASPASCKHADTSSLAPRSHCTTPPAYAASKRAKISTPSWPAKTGGAAGSGGGGGGPKIPETSTSETLDIVGAAALETLVVFDVSCGCWCYNKPGHGIPPCPATCRWYCCTSSDSASSVMAES
ncbi:hypothetical protein TSOC_005552 [Tetrabaena socialis]|uniref:Uncharacterized protein n=1 Tax=Tetrabaena socialis TaxID=47790 RepID=A0A2J8A5X5_9CHLO|nr:hypothetical protein TSOC_005552 [Tetrabaena socialis]|eukprot:PNH07929.1 hypothetical protein TSOC_005552 [Tetrabaena socialis]